MDKYLKVCRSFIRSGNDSVRGCVRYLLNAPNTFLLALGTKLKGTQEVGTPQIALWVRRAGAGEKEDELFRDLLGQAARNWGRTGSVDDISTLDQEMPHISVKDRRALYKEFLDARITGDLLPSEFDRDGHSLKPARLDYLQARLASWEVPEKIKGKEDALLNAFTQDKKDIAVAKFRYAVRRLEAGHGDAASIEKALRDLLAIALGPKEKLESIQEYGDGAFNTFALLKALETDAGTEALVKVLLEPGNIAGLSHFAKAFDVMNKLTAKVKEPTTSLLVDAFVKDMKGKTVFGDNLLYYYLVTNEAAPRAKYWLDELKKGPQSDPDMQKARHEYLSKVVREKEGTAPEVMAWLKESTYEHPLLYLPTKMVASTPALKERLIAGLDSIDEEKNPGKRYLTWAPHSDAATFSVLAPEIASRLSNLWRKAGEYTGGDDLATAFVVGEGGNKALTATVFSEVEKLAADETFMASSAEPGRLSKYADKRAASLVNFVQVMNLGKEGRVWMNEHPELSKRLAAYVAAEEDKNALMSSRFPIPAPMLEPLREALPPVKEFAKSEGAPRWVTHLLGEDPKSLPKALEYLNGGSKDIQQEMAYAIQELVAKHPELAETVRNGTTNPQMLRMLEGVR